jgi:hypothetical protein
MFAPLLIPALAAAPRVRSRLPRGSSASDLFVVAEEGSFGGRRWRQGDLIEVSGTGDGVAVLAPRGFGRVRLGTVQGTRLFGDAGEPCSAERWSVAGYVRAVYHRLGEDWTAETWEAEASALAA